MHNALSGQLKLYYRGSTYSPQEVLPLTGAKKVFIMLGVNDIALYGGLDRAIEYWEIFLTSLEEASPDAVFFIESCLPVYHEAEYEYWNNALFDDFNLLLQDLCEKHGCVYVELASYFKDKNNSLDAKYCSDKLCHLTHTGSALWVEQLKNPANYSVDPRSIDYD